MSTRGREDDCPKCGESCYAEWLNDGPEKVPNVNKVLREREFCGHCEAHVGAAGLCLNMCSLSVGTVRKAMARLYGVKPVTGL